MRLLLVGIVTLLIWDTGVRNLSCICLDFFTINQKSPNIAVTFQSPPILIKHRSVSFPHCCNSGIVRFQLCGLSFWFGMECIKNSCLYFLRKLMKIERLAKRGKWGNLQSQA